MTDSEPSPSSFSSKVYAAVFFDEYYWNRYLISKLERQREREIKAKKRRKKRTLGKFKLNKRTLNFFFSLSLPYFFFLWSCAGTNQWIADTRNQTLITRQDKNNVGWNVFYSRSSSSSLVSASLSISLGPAASPPQPAATFRTADPGSRSGPVNRLKLSTGALHLAAI